MQEEHSRDTRPMEEDLREDKEGENTSVTHQTPNILNLEGRHVVCDSTTTSPPHKRARISNIQGAGGDVKNAKEARIGQGSGAREGADDSSSLLPQYPHQLVVADHTRDWQVVLKDPIGKNMVLYNRGKRKYVVVKANDAESASQERKNYCPLCGQETASFQFNHRRTKRAREHAEAAAAAVTSRRATRAILDPQVTPDYFLLIDKLPRLYSRGGEGGAEYDDDDNHPHLEEDQKTKDATGNQDNHGNDDDDDGVIRGATKEEEDQEAIKNEGRKKKQQHQQQASSRYGEALPSDAFNEGYYKRFFEEKRMLGCGSFGAVFLCHHKLQGVVLGAFAVKKIPVGDSTTWCLKVLKEVTILQTLHHKNIVDYKHSWLEHSRNSQFAPVVPCLFVLMEYADHGNLAKYIWPGSINRPRTLDNSTIRYFIDDICQGLNHLHNAGLIHRDLKPENILIKRDSTHYHFNRIPPHRKHERSDEVGGNEDGFMHDDGDIGNNDDDRGDDQKNCSRRVNRRRHKDPHYRSHRDSPHLGDEKQQQQQQEEEEKGFRPPFRLLISDFGQTYFKGTKMSKHGFQGIGNYGTVAYMAPEALVPDIKYPNPYTEASDMWSVGAMLYVMMYSDLPYEADTAEAMKELIYSKKLKLEDLNLKRPRELEMLVKGLMRVDPKDRMKMSAVLQILQTAILAAKSKEEGEVGAATSVARMETEMPASRRRRRRANGGLGRGGGGSSKDVVDNHGYSDLRGNRGEIVVTSSTPIISSSTTSSSPIMKGSGLNREDSIETLDAAVVEYAIISDDDDHDGGGGDGTSTVMVSREIRGAAPITKPAASITTSSVSSTPHNPSTSAAAATTTTTVFPLPDDAGGGNDGDSKMGGERQLVTPPHSPPFVPSNSRMRHVSAATAVGKRRRTGLTRTPSMTQRLWKYLEDNHRRYSSNITIFPQPREQDGMIMMMIPLWHLVANMVMLLLYVHVALIGSASMVMTAPPVLTCGVLIWISHLPYHNGSKMLGHHHHHHQGRKDHQYQLKNTWLYLIRVYLPIFACLLWTAFLLLLRSSPPTLLSLLKRRLPKIILDFWQLTGNEQQGQQTTRTLYRLIAVGILHIVVNMALIRRADGVVAARLARENAHMFDGRTNTTNVRPLILPPSASAIALSSSLPRIGDDSKVLAPPTMVDVTTGHELKRLPPMIEGSKNKMASPLNDVDDGHHGSSSPASRELDGLRRRHSNYRQ